MVKREAAAALALKLLLKSLQTETGISPPPPPVVRQNKVLGKPCDKKSKIFALYLIRMSINSAATFVNNSFT